MIYFINRKEQNMYIYCLPIKNSQWNSRDTELLSFISQKRRQMLLNYHYDIDRKLSLYSALVTRMNLSLLSGIPNTKLTFYNAPYHKPYLLSDPQLHFNFSHTKNFIICCISTVAPVGADTEKISDAPLSIINDLFHPIEIDYITNINSIHIQNSRFFKMWTMKEAYVKCSGTGLNSNLSFNNLLDPKFTPHFHSWKQENYACSVFSYVPEKCLVTQQSENTIHQFFLNR